LAGSHPDRQRITPKKGLTMRKSSEYILCYMNTAGEWKHTFIYDSALQCPPDAEPDSIRYNEFGQMTTPESSIDPNFMYQPARHYDPTPRRWLSEEPLGFAADEPNLYRYVHQPKTEGQ
jgi:RHS repeat-associated protein